MIPVIDPAALAVAFGVISASTIGIVEAVKLWLPGEAKPVASIVIGAALATLYLFMPAAYQPLFLVVLAGATGTGTVAVAKRIGGAPPIVVQEGPVDQTVVVPKVN